MKEVEKLATEIRGAGGVKVCFGKDERLLTAYEQCWLADGLQCLNVPFASAAPEVEYIEIGHLMKNEYGFVSAHAPDLGALPVGKTVVYMRSPRGTKP